jgi:hypothetical protein
VAGESSKDEYESWEPIPAAEERVSHAIGYERARTEINRRITLGLLGAVARERFDDAGAVTLFQDVRDAWIAGEPSIHADVWTTGSYDVTFNRHSPRSRIARCQAIRVDPAGIDLMLSDAGKLILRTPKTLVVTPSAPETAPPKGGRPRAAYWEDAILAGVKLIWDGDATIKNQAALEAAISKWIEDHYHEIPSEASIRTRAAKIWKIHNSSG